MFLLRIAEAMVASQESFLNSPDHAKTVRDYSSSVVTDSDRDELHKLSTSDTTLSESMLEGSEQLARIRLACSRDSCTPSPNSITTVSVRTNSPGSSNPSPRISVASPGPSDGGNPSSPGYQQPQGGLLYSLLVGSETNTTTGLCRSPFRTMSTPSRTSSGTPSISNGLRRSHTQMSLDMEDTADAKDTMMDRDRLVNPVDTKSRLAAALTASEWGTLNGTSLPNGHMTASPSRRRNQKVVQQHRPLFHLLPQQQSQQRPQPVPNRIRANSLGAHKISQLKTCIRPHAMSIGSNGNSVHPLSHTVTSRLHHKNHTTNNSSNNNSSNNNSNPTATNTNHHHHSQAPYRRHLDGNTPWDGKSKMGVRYRSFSKTSPEMNFLIRSHSFSTSQSGSVSTLPTGPTATQPHLSVAHSHPVVAPNHSSGYNSAAFNPSPLTSLSTDSGLDEPVDLTGHGASQTNGLSHRTRPQEVDTLQLVQLAKKTARPVQARVTEWIRQVAEFVALSAPVLRTMNLNPNGPHPQLSNGNYRELDMDMWLVLLNKCWHRLLALSMVEHAMDLVVVEHTLSDELVAVDARQVTREQIGLPWILLPEVKQVGLGTVLTDRSKRPDRKFANAFLQFLSEIRQAGLSAQEFYLLRHVILLTAHEPLSLSTLGLNVIRASRQVNPSARSNGQGFREEPSTTAGTVGQRVKVKPVTSTVMTQPCPTSVQDSSEELKQSFDLACLACGLKALSVLCPYRMAHLFCSHLYNSNNLNANFLVELHRKFVTSLHELGTAGCGSREVEGAGEGVGEMDVPTIATSPEEPPSSVIMSSDPDSINSITATPSISILEQLFDSS